MRIVQFSAQFLKLPDFFGSHSFRDGDFTIAMFASIRDVHDDAVLIYGEDLSLKLIVPKELTCRYVLVHLNKDMASAEVCWSWIHIAPHHTTPHCTTLHHTTLHWSIFFWCWGLGMPPGPSQGQSLGREGVPPLPSSDSLLRPVSVADMYGSIDCLRPRR